MKIVVKRRSVYSKIFYILWLLYSLAFFYCQQTEFSYEYDTSDFFQALSLLVGIVLLLLFLLTKRFKIRQFFIYVLILGVFSIPLMLLRDKYLLVLLGFALNARYADIEDFVKFDMKLKIFVLFSVVSLCLGGVIQNYTATINGAYKQAFGFSHPNVLSGVVYCILVEWIFIRFEKIKVWDWIVIALASYFVWTIAASRTTAYTFWIVFALFLLAKVFPQIFQYKVVTNVCALLPAFFAAMSFLLVRLYEQGNVVALFINEITTKRLKQALNMLNTYGVSAFGQFVNTRGTRTVDYTLDALFSVDMSYIIIPVRYGIFILAFLLIGYFFFIKNTGKAGNTKLLLATMYFVSIGLAETYFYRITYNFTLIFILIYVGRDVLQKVSMDKEF